MTSTTTCQPWIYPSSCLRFLWMLVFFPLPLISLLPPKSAQPNAKNIYILNKVDLVPRRAELEKIVALLKEKQPIKLRTDWDSTFHTSATTGEGVPELKQFLLANATSGDWEYSPDASTDQTKVKRFEEIIREQLFLHLRKELPYTLSQHIVRWTEDSASGAIAIDLILWTKSNSQKLIVIGTQGSKISTIGRGAQTEMSAAFGVPVDVRISVQVAGRKELSQLLAS
eukprot:m.53962 g.53962  ORF g.53962 m.53962 type:complete len:227 (-) comp48678_c0_seq1:180-860(-)